jgi:hypothetical protein
MANAAAVDLIFGLMRVSVLIGSKTLWSIALMHTIPPHFYVTGLCGWFRLLASLNG